MRDLKKDKAMCNAEITETPGAYTIDVEELEKGFYMWRERAIKAEAEVERLKEEAHQDIEWLYKEYVLEADVNLSQDAIDLKRKLRDMVCKELQAENARLRKVVEAAREFFEGTGCKPKECKKCDPKYINFCERSGIGQALAELDKEGDK